jgi:molybdopterin molybdotransferase
VASVNPSMNVLEWQHARSLIIEKVRERSRPSKIEMVSLDSCHGRVLASDLLADRDYPALARSLRDGFAVHSSDVPGSLKIIGEVRAGESEKAELPSGHALEIMTGAPVPAGADSIVMVEHAERRDGTVVIAQSTKPGQFINTQGAEARRQTVLIPAGTRLDTSHVATLAMTGHASAAVFRKPAVAILSTGDELVAIEQTPAPHQIRNSNSHSLAALVAAAGGEPVLLPVAKDNEDHLTRSLEQGLQSDMLLVSGGVSAGKYDLVKPCLRRLGAEFHFERVKIQPGQPTAFGTCQDKFVFGLPGNPGSSMVTFQLFARAASDLLAGVQEPLLPIFFAKFRSPFQHKRGLTRFLPARQDESGTIEHIPWQGSSDVPALTKANLFLIADHDRESWNAGDMIRVMLKP